MRRLTRFATVIIAWLAVLFLAWDVVVQHQRLWARLWARL
jgi:hypothetical protein